MPGVLNWGWDATNKVWVPLRLDPDGSIHVVGYVDKLDDIGDVSVAAPTDGYVLYWDAATSLWKAKAIPSGAWADITGKPTAPSLEELATQHDASGLHAGMVLDNIGDVSVPTPGDQYFVYRDAATSLWKCRALVDADIPAAIARDTEVATAVSTHAALTTTHGAADAIADQADIAAHAAIAAAHFSNIITITFIIDGGGSAITTGQKGHLEIPFACTLTAYTLVADVAGAIVIDVWKDTYANFPPTDADAMPGAGKEPAIAATNQKNQDTDISDWTAVAVAAGDILAFNVDSCTTITRVTLSLKATKT